MKFSILYQLVSRMEAMYGLLSDGKMYTADFPWKMIYFLKKWAMKNNGKNLLHMDT